MSTVDIITKMVDSFEGNTTDSCHLNVITFDQLSHSICFPGFVDAYKKLLNAKLYKYNFVT